MRQYQVVIDGTRAILKHKGGECSIQEVIREGIEEKGISKEQLVRESGIDRVALFRFLAGTQNISFDKLLNIFAVLKIRIRI